MDHSLVDSRIPFNLGRRAAPWGLVHLAVGQAVCMEVEMNSRSPALIKVRMTSLTEELLTEFSRLLDEYGNILWPQRLRSCFF